ncbi:hypothetical protein J3A83DRAFT_433597 [Scleroderma citrinum]
MSNHPQNHPNSHLQQIRSLITHFETAPVKHFDVSEELVVFWDVSSATSLLCITRHLVSRVSALDGAITLQTSGILRCAGDVSSSVSPESLYLIQTSSANNISSNVHPGEANRDDEDTQLAYLNRDRKDRNFEFLCKGRCADGTLCNRPVSFNSCADHLDWYHDTSSSKDVQCPWCFQTKSRKNLARHYQEVHLRFPRWRRP